MKKTIQITTVREYANVQVIRLDAAFVAKAVQARFAAQSMDKILPQGMSTRTEVTFDAFEINELIDAHILVGQFVEELYKAILPDEDDNGANENTPTNDSYGADCEDQKKLDEED